MNYIKHLSGFFDKVSNDDRLNPAHISLYISLFQFWNACRFHNPISISRNEAMKVSKIASKATYHKCIRDLNDFGYLKYLPSYNPFKGSLVYLFDFRTGTEPAENRNHTKMETSTEQALVPYINTTNRYKHKTKLNLSAHRQKNSIDLNFKKDEGRDNIENEPKRKKVAQKKENKSEKKNFVIPGISEVKEYFSSQKSDPIEAEKFFNHFQSNGWLVGGRSKMHDWQAAARNWMLNETKFQTNKMSVKPGNRNVTKTKNYNEPL